MRDDCREVFSWDVPELVADPAQHPGWECGIGCAEYGCHNWSACTIPTAAPPPGWVKCPGSHSTDWRPEHDYWTDAYPTRCPRCGCAIQVRRGSPGLPAHWIEP